MRADNVHYMHRRARALHTFDAEVPEELTVRPGEEVCCCCWLP